jgi:Holliday junction resolvase
MHHRTGIPDVIAIWKGKFLGIEVKSETGRLSLPQKQIIQEITEHEGIAFMAKGFDDVERELRIRGLYP